ncbi:hypothetical protein GGG16DRAFT_123562 [Schizophyllum commune]
MLSTDAPHRATRHGTYYLDDGDVVVHVEDTLYRLHSFHLQRATTRFDAITKSLGDHAGVKEGGSDDHPLVLEGVQSLDFAHLLWFFYDSAYKWSGIIDHALTPKWESVLLVAETFDMKQVAKVACFALGRAGALSDVRKIGLAAKHDLGKDWAVEELKRVIAREAPLTTEEGRELGTDLTVMLAASRETQVRNQTLDSKPCAVTYCRTCCEEVLCQNRRHSCTFCRRSFPCPILRSVLDVTAIVDNITFPPLPRTFQHLLTWMKCLINVASGSTPGQMSCRWRTDIGQDLFVKVKSVVLGIHSYHLRRASSVFVDMLNLPVHGAAGEGKSRNHPIVLDIQPRQFENLLWFLYDSPYEWSYKANAALSPKWEDILVVGDMFNMEEACRVATYALDHNGGLPDVRKVSLCVRYDVDRNWAIEAIKRLCARRVALTREEARDIGLDMAIAIASAREAAYNASGGKISVGGSTLDEIVQKAIAGA